jgi:hypothetical protein
MRSDLERFIESGELRCSVCLNSNLPLNEVRTGKKAFVNMPCDGEEAIALICDDCKGRNAQPTFLIQYDENRIINHNIEIDRLEDLKQPKKVVINVNEEVKLSEDVSVVKL